MTKQTSKSIQIPLSKRPWSLVVIPIVLIVLVIFLYLSRTDRVFRDRNNTVKFRYPATFSVTEDNPSYNLFLITLVPKEHYGKQYIEGPPDKMTIRSRLAENSKDSEPELKNKHTYTLLVAGQELIVTEGAPPVVVGGGPTFTRSTSLVNGYLAYTFTSSGSIDRDTFDSIVTSFEFTY